MRTSQNIRAWINFDGENFEFNVTVAPISVSRPSIPTLSYKNLIIANYVSSDMNCGWLCRVRANMRFRVLPMGETHQRVYRGTLSNKTQVVVKYVNHDSKQGLREFMAEILSMGRLQHKNLVQMRGWCRKGNELMLVYDYMPNGSLKKWVFDNLDKLLGWEQQHHILVDVVKGLNYLHHGWDQVVIHKDVKSSNILLDAEMRGRLGDFGLAMLYQHGEVLNTTRVVGTLGYLALELATVTTPTSASDVYNFGVLLLEVVEECHHKLDSNAER
ncbi:hypothetical protein RJT34_26684 [Clitoria ternatea]|uniref:non-specific serine/threonine protein kinase n=1 Tax=Clitoria ternatea TaxID=43366 RepID=A0AAN9IBQ1_CLITE